MLQDKEEIDLKVDVSVLKERLNTLAELCNKMDRVIEKMTDSQQDLTTQIYEDMDKKNDSTADDIKDLHSRITTVDRSLSDKIGQSERRLLDEIKSLREHITAHNQKEEEDFKRLSQWRYMTIGGVIVLAWLISNIKIETIGKFFS